MSHRLAIDLAPTATAWATASAAGANDGSSAGSVPTEVVSTVDGRLLAGGEIAHLDPSLIRSVHRGFADDLGDPAPVMVDGTPYARVSLASLVIAAVLRADHRIAGQWPDVVVLVHAREADGYRLGLLVEAARGAGVPMSALALAPREAVGGAAGPPTTAASRTIDPSPPAAIAAIAVGATAGAGLGAAGVGGAGIALAAGSSAPVVGSAAAGYAGVPAATAGSAATGTATSSTGAGWGGAATGTSGIGYPGLEPSSVGGGSAAKAARWSSRARFGAAAAVAVATLAVGAAVVATDDGDAAPTSVPSSTLATAVVASAPPTTSRPAAPATTAPVTASTAPSSVPPPSTSLAPATSAPPDAAGCAIGSWVVRPESAAALVQEAFASTGGDIQVVSVTGGAHIDVGVDGSFVFTYDDWAVTSASASQSLTSVTTFTGVMRSLVVFGADGSAEFSTASTDGQVTAEIDVAGTQIDPVVTPLVGVFDGLGSFACDGDELRVSMGANPSEIVADRRAG